MPSPSAAPVEPKLLGVRLSAELAQACGGESRRLFVLLDAARVKGLPALLKALQVPHCNLFRGNEEIELAHVAPYLASLALDGDLQRWLEITPEAFAAALLLVSDADLDALRTHFRRFLLALDSTGAERYFRLYDPRVLEPLLVASSPAESLQIFGPVQAFYARAADDELLSAQPALKAWVSPRRRGETAAAPPDAKQKFQLSPEHEAAFSRVLAERYQKKCLAWLRKVYPARLEDTTDDELRGMLGRAKKLGDRLGIVTGRDLTALAEVLVVKSADEVRERLEAAPPERRGKALWEWADQVWQAEQTPAT